MAAADEYPNPDDDEFDDYNPHPYSGGYDISATYGAPLPSSPSTCYPISSHLHSRRSPHPRTHRSAAALACACCVTSAVFACATAVDFARAQEAATAAGGGALLLPEPYDYVPEARRTWRKRQRLVILEAGETLHRQDVSHVVRSSHQDKIIPQKESA